MALAGDFAGRRLAIWRSLASACALAILGVVTPAASADPAPAPTPHFLPGSASDKCSPETERLFPECRRLHFAYGPVAVTPGNNQSLISPVTIEKPAYDGYAMRVRYNLIRSDGSIPAVDKIHLHHMVMVSEPAYGPQIQFGGTGEEKTIAEPRPPYGMLVRGTDVWLMNYMLHNLTTDTELLWITYDVDFIPSADAEQRGVKPMVPIWLDVKRGMPRDFYPVFNAVRGYGHWSKRNRRQECSYPKERCAPTDPWGTDQPGNGRGWDYTVPADYAGTLVLGAGHVHPGGLRVELSIIRNINGSDRVRRLFNSEAKYWDPKGPISWDMAMTVTPPNWKVRVRPGDRLRINAVYDTSGASWYESMGIFLAFVAPGDQSGVDPFQRMPARKRRGRSRAHSAALVPIPLVGQVTHGHLPENDNHGGIRPWQLPAKNGPVVDSINIAAFQNRPGDLSTIAQEGVPTVKADRPVTFYNNDWLAGILHSVTACKAPCSATTGISYPLADDGTALDSLEMGFSPDFGPAANTDHTDRWTVVPDKVGLRPGDTFTYFCRVHPFMRGAFRVVQ